MTVELLDYLREDKKRMEPEHDKRVKAFTRWYKQFRGIIDKSKKSTKSQLFIQRTKVACIAGIANVIDIIFPSDDFFDVLGRNDPDVAGAEATKKVVSWALRAGRFFREAVRYILQAVVYGTAFAKIIPWEVRELSLKKIPVPLDASIPGAPIVGYETTYEPKVVKLAKLETIDVADVWVDPLGLGVDREYSSGLFHRFRRTVGYLRKMEKEGIYKNVAQVIKLVAEREKPHTEQDDRRLAVGLPDVKYDPQEVVLFEYSGRIPSDVAKRAKIAVPEGEFETEIIATIAGEDFDVLLRAERNTMPNQMRMWISDVWEPTTEKSMYGRGIPENVRGSQQALNVTVNLRLDNKAWAIAAPLVVNIDKLAHPNEDLVARVNWIIRGRGASPPEIAQFAQIPNITDNSPVEQAEFERHIDEESGMNKQVQATQSFGSNRTFGGISLAYSAAARPVRLIAKGFEDNLVSQALKKIFVLLVLFLEPWITIRVTDDPRAPEYFKYDPLSLALDVDFLASGSFALAQRDQTVQSMVAFFDALSKLPMLAQLPNWNWKYGIQKLYEAMGLKDFQKIWIDNPMPGMIPGAGGMNATPTTTPAGTAGAGTPAGTAEGTVPVQALAALGRLVGGGEGGAEQGMA